jgi:DNA-binding transcriptional regulator YiaG
MPLTANDLVELRDLRRFLRTGQARRLRLRAGLSLPEVAGAIGASAPAVYRWEVGERSPRGERAVRYWRLLQSLGGAKAG